MPLSVLRLLSPEDFRSGEEISRQLAISRASVHNAVNQARALGAEIHAVRGRGYRLGCHYTWLDGQALQEGLAGLGYELDVRDHVDSTNTRLLALAQQGLGHKRVLAAELQSGGRGRRGRTWHGLLGGSLTFSLLWRFNRPLTGLSGLSLVVGLALARSLRAIGAGRAMVKWPNDILLDGRKLAGILIETQGDMLSAATAVIGIGVNIQAGAELENQAGLAVADLAGALDPLPDRNAVLVAILTELARVLPEFDAQGFPPFAAAWQAMHAWQGRRVQVIHAGGVVAEGEAAGVDEQGALLLAMPEGLQRIHSGELSLRPA
jgi:BirA family biotin operon repressor/biotin-[acetyl-CoA-carboxylase] ligase